MGWSDLKGRDLQRSIDPKSPEMLDTLLILKEGGKTALDISDRMAFAS